MLDVETKARIDSARDILVGKVPDPKSQVEQITIALIYKFMDDMDRQSEELGGKATFFTGDFKKYHWANLLDKRLGGHERLLLYAEGIEKMNENKNIPQLFRDIFKGVFLPYRDPETLNLFLKEIAGFSYDHSERLGDAFEYLLSVLGTQGDAGQFRTPRHIIDFIVAVVDPQKHETVLDPACGTAGFLVSAFKHILRNNENLTPDERARLMTNFRGYDIAPDMVRLSRANLYLHGFPNPVIHEYDTLTSEERWDERCDVILANPPFMSPKGGIRPHNRFSIKAKRSEVLFVDYMAEHLNSGGRAGIIVPEGIIFQSQNAYKALRKMLVENYLWAVVSLPAGVFNPYAGVKTSILFLDRNLARRTDELLFLKVENDGFDLGAQRRPNGKNDLPEALKILDGHKKEHKTQESKLALTVGRKRLLESPDINLSGDRYRTAATRPSGKWPMVKLGEVCSLMTGGTPKSTVKEYYENGTVPWLVSGDIHKGEIGECEGRITEVGVRESNAKYLPINSVLIALNGQGRTRGTVALLRMSKATCNQSLVSMSPLPDSRLKPEFLFHVLRVMYDQIRALTGDEERSGLNMPILREIEIPLPPLEEQEQIVAELEGYRKIIEGARQILANYKPTIKIDPTWPVKRLSEVSEINRESIDPVIAFGENSFTYLDISSVESGTGSVALTNQVESAKAPSRARRVIQNGDVLLSTVRPNLKAFAYLENLPERVLASTGFAVLTPLNGLSLGKFLWFMMFEDASLKQMVDRMEKGAYPSINQTDVEQIEISLPPLSIQRQIVAELEEERKLVEANRELIARMEAKIKAKLAEMWGDEDIATEGTKGT